MAEWQQECEGTCWAVLHNDSPDSGEVVLMQNIGCQKYDHVCGEGVDVPLVYSTNTEDNLPPSPCTVLGWGDVPAEAVESARRYTAIICRVHGDGDVQAAVERLGLQSQLPDSHTDESVVHVDGDSEEPAEQPQQDAGSESQGTQLVDVESFTEAPTSSVMEAESVPPQPAERHDIETDYAVPVFTWTTPNGEVMSGTAMRRLHYIFNLSWPPNDE